MNNGNFVPKVIPMREFVHLPNLEGKTILELGNKGNKNGVYRDDYLRAGAKSYHSTDLNGLDGAIPLDLRSESAAEQIKEATGMDSFDIITNFGMSEHIPVQRTFYQCMHNLGHIGSIFVHWTPRARMFVEHGYHGSIFHAEDNFFDKLTMANNYKVISSPTFAAEVNRIITCVLQKQEDTPFVWESYFRELFWYNELWEQSPDAKLFKEMIEKQDWFAPVP